MPCGGAVGSRTGDISRGREAQVLPTGHLCVGRRRLPWDVTRIVQKLSWVRRGKQEHQPAPTFTPRSQNGRLPSWDSSRRGPDLEICLVSRCQTGALAVPLGILSLRKRSLTASREKGQVTVDGRESTADRSVSADDVG